MDNKRLQLIVMIGSGVAILLVICLILLGVVLARDAREGRAARVTLDPAEESPLKEVEEPQGEAALKTPPAAEKEHEALKSEKKQPEREPEAEGRADADEDAETSSDELRLTFKNPDGERVCRGQYSGETRSGKPHGQGSFRSVNADGIAWTYTGEWRNGRAEGEGKAVWTSEDGSTLQTCEGTFENGAFTDGDMSYEDGSHSYTHSGPYPAPSVTVPTPPSAPKGFPQPSLPSPPQQSAHFLDF